MSLTTRAEAPGSERPGSGSLALINRDRLLAALDRAATRRVTIISAPAGSGKSTLLRSWAARPGHGHRLATVQVRRDEQDAQHFWRQLLAAVSQTTGAPSLGDALSGSAWLNVRSMVDKALTALAEARAGTVLVIDDLHELIAPEALTACAGLLERLPAGVCTILATRHDPALRLHRLRLAGEVAEIREADLRFTEDETRELLTASGLELSAGAQVRLHQRTEGWAAGLRLAALSLTGNRDPERFVEQFSGTHRPVAEYLLAEMLDRQPDEVRDLLLRTCLLDHVNGELADLLTGRTGSDRLLLDLEDANAFVLSTDLRRTWFRYHQLFADLLRLQLRRTLPSEVGALHRQAASWFTRHDQVADAIRHTQAAGDWDDAARRLADHAISLIMDGDGETVQALLRAFPRGVPAENPELAMVRAARSLARGRLDDADAQLTIAESHAEAEPTDRRHRLRMATRVSRWPPGAATSRACWSRPPPTHRGRPSGPAATSRWRTTCGHSPCST
ncbi:MAG TPA: AAA family ATPase [Pseudonocardia sp.]|nr:AAA family ATPase [Pseudonocardia sp.]